MAEPQIGVGEAESNKYPSPPSPKTNSVNSECEDTISSVKLMSSPKYELFELKDEIWEKIVINLLAHHLSILKDSFAGSVGAEFRQEIEHVLTAFFFFSAYKL